MNLKKHLFFCFSFLIGTIVGFSHKEFLNKKNIFNKISYHLLKSSEKPSLTIDEIRLVINPELPNKIDKVKVAEIINKKRIQHKNREIILQRFEENKLDDEDEQYFDSNCLTSSMFWQNIELFCGQTELSAHLLSKVNRTISDVGYIMLAKMLAQPTTDINKLKRRQLIVKELIEDEGLFKQLDLILKEYKKIESDLLTFWDQKIFTNLFGSDFYYPPDFISFLPDDLLDVIFPQKIKNFLNKSPKALEFLALTDNFSSLQSLAHNFEALGALRLINRGLKDENKEDKLHQFWNAWLNTKSEFDKAKIADSILDKLKHGWLTFWNSRRASFAIYQILLSINSVSKICKGEKKKYKILKVAYSKLRSAATVVNSLVKLQEATKKNECICNNLEIYQKIQYLFDKTTSGSKKFDVLLEYLTDSSFEDKDPRVLKLMLSRGKILACSLLMQRAQNNLIDMMQSIGQIDVYLSIAKLYKQFVGQDVTYSFVQYLDQDNPYIKLDGFWTPFINAENVVINEIELGKEGFSKGAIISGPNAGGKSTILKSIIINLLLAQTIGIAPCQKIIFTPFSYLDTYLNIIDDITSGNSLFKAEVLRVKELLQTLNTLNPRKCFVIMDEMFNGTNPLEGEAAGFAVACALAKIPNSITLIASHYAKMTTLEQETAGKFKNYKVSVIKNDNKTLTYPFKLEQGKTDQTIAIDILENEKFDTEIIEDARKVIATAV
ncbi:hypothetical protein GF322_04395 [Candidatus Dependentiae bacterium]|nr:hypothetical protein [Candidatus Dependentiae bacterium]